MNSVKIISTDESAVRSALKTLADSLKKRPEVLAVYLCGSWAKGNYTPYSDVDLLVLVAEDGRKPHDRIPLYLPDSFPVGLDIFAYTPDELEKSRFARRLLKGALLL